VAELAAMCGLSPSHFRYAFRQTIGAPPHQWLLEQRIEKAKDLLVNTTASLCEIGLETGFPDQSHFTRVFSQRVKTSPAAWRKAHLS
jgi:AraC family transcriptional regulator